MENKKIIVIQTNIPNWARINSNKDEKEENWNIIVLALHSGKKRNGKIVIVGFMRNNNKKTIWKKNTNCLCSVYHFFTDNLLFHIFLFDSFSLALNSSWLKLFLCLRMVCQFLDLFLHCKYFAPLPCLSRRVQKRCACCPTTAANRRRKEINFRYKIN